MSLQYFEAEFLNLLMNDDLKCIQVIENNSKLIDEHYNATDSLKATIFVAKLNSVVLELSNYKLLEKVLYHPLFAGILAEFRQSDIMIKACQNNKYKKLVEWLLNQEINPDLQDEFGRTALMYAAQHYPLTFAVEKFLKYKNKKNDFVNYVDNDGNTALFHGLQNKDVFIKMLKTNLFDVRHVNNNNENLLLYCCRIDKYQSVEKLIDLGLDATLVNNVGKNAAMYLVENKRFHQLEKLVDKTKLNVNYMNKFGETLVSVYLKSYYKGITDCILPFFNESNYLGYKNYASTLMALIKMGCDFNVIIDEDGNTPIIFLLLIEDYVSANYLLKNSKINIDLSHKNKDGISASLLASFLNSRVFDDLDYQKSRNKGKISMSSLTKLIHENRTFDPSFGTDVYYMAMPAQTRYKKSNYSIIVQQWYLEVLYPNCGAVIKHSNHQITNSNGSYVIPHTQTLTYY